MNNTEIAKKVIEALGGRENVNSVAHCATRLRVMVKDEEKIDKDTVENLEKVQGAFFNSGQYQIIFGTGTVNKIYEEVVALGLPTSSKAEMKAEAAKQGNWFQRAIRTFGDVFVPIIPVIVATGLFMGVRGLLNALGMTLPEDVTIYSQILTDTDFIEDSEERETRIGPLIDEAIADADGEIDGYLVKRYAVPLAPVPKVINKFSKDIALYNLMSRAGLDEEGREGNYLTRYNAAIKFLTLVAEGKVSLGTEASDPQAAAAAGFSMHSNRRLFSRDTMKGM